ncbi:MAG TPA: polymer-forming cytoskeletal protein [bacterium]|jgi:cytoskeletal protein CcmA (bactofilin family)
MSKWVPKNLQNLRDTHPGDISTLFGKETEIRGSVKTQGSLRVDGTVHGDITCAKTITIGSTGVVEGNISGEDVIVAGKVKGSLSARGRVSLESSAQIEGDLNTSRLSIAEGAVFRGLSNMGVTVRAPIRVAEDKTDGAESPKMDRVAAA